MPDGVRLAVDVILPRDAPAGSTFPALMKISRFGRAPADGSIPDEERFWVAHGYARVLVDERGSGASFGNSRFGRDTVDDLRALVDWIVLQPWSNGRVGAIGVSVEGTAAELLAATGHPAVRAVAPWFSDYNYYTDLIRPGGIYDEWLMAGFAAFAKQADAGAAAKSVDGDTDGLLRAAAVAGHGANVDVHRATREAPFIDDILPGTNRSLADISIPPLRKRLAVANVPMLIAVSWFDAATVQGAIERFRVSPNTQHVVIGAWSHGAHFNANPFDDAGTPVAPSLEGQWLEALAFFDRYLRGDPLNGARRIDYYTIGENAWHSTATWPPAGMRIRRLHLNADGTLGAAGSGSSRNVRLEVTSTGEKNRWHTQLGGQNVVYDDAMPGMRSLASFTSGPLPKTMVITGQPVLRLRLVCTMPDPSVLAYLVAVDAAGRMRYLTEGELRLIDRKIDPAARTLHSWRRDDARAVPSGTAVDASLTLLPLSAMLRKGDRLLLLLAGGDRSTFVTAGAYDATLFSSSTLELPIESRK
jgi:putative CocE/NonD family hydrolase